MITIIGLIILAVAILALLHVVAIATNLAIVLAIVGLLMVMFSFGGFNGWRKS